MEKVTEIAESQQVGKNSTEGDEAAGLLENISVEDKKSEEKAKEDDKGKSPGLWLLPSQIIWSLGIDMIVASKGVILGHVL
ncbi:unnamed protein product, partial [Brassica oleracea]